MGEHIAWNTGGTATVVGAGGMLVTVRSSRPFPPGAPVAGTLTTDRAYAFTLKVAGARKIAEHRWELRGRLLTPTSDVIVAFARAVAPD